MYFHHNEIDFGFRVIDLQYCINTSKQHFHHFIIVYKNTTFYKIIGRFGMIYVEETWKIQHNTEFC